MARVLIVGCGCRGRALAGRLLEAGHAVRGTTRDPRSVDAIRAAGAEPYVGDPDRIATLMEALTGVTVVCWLLGTTPVRELHGPRLRMMLERVVDTPVRGVLYEPAPAPAGGGTAIAREAAETWRIPLEVLPPDPAGGAAWVASAASAVERLLGYTPESR
jgi:uncharacterized protein YbjT (DUF2867 family)